MSADGFRQISESVVVAVVVAVRTKAGNDLAVVELNIRNARREPEWKRGPDIGRVVDEIKAARRAEHRAVGISVPCVEQQRRRKGDGRVHGNVTAGSVGAGGGNAGNAESSEESAGLLRGNGVIEKAAEHV